MINGQSARTDADETGVRDMVSARSGTRPQNPISTCLLDLTRAADRQGAKEAARRIERRSASVGDESVVGRGGHAARVPVAAGAPTAARHVPRLLRVGRAVGGE